MFTDMKNAQIFNSVVGFDAVNVVNLFPLFQFPAHVLLHNPAVLQITDTINSYAAILFVVIGTLMFGITRLTTKPFGLFSRLCASKGGFAAKAFNQAFLIFGFNPAILRTKLCFVLAIRFYLKSIIAMLADQCNHAAIVAAKTGGCNG